MPKITASSDDIRDLVEDIKNLKNRAVELSLYNVAAPLRDAFDAARGVYWKKIDQERLDNIIKNEGGEK